MQRIEVNIKALLETSVFMINTERLPEGVWNTSICQHLLSQTHVLYSNLINDLSLNTDEQTFIWTDDPRPDESRLYLIVSLLRETLNPFFIKWESVFFKTERKMKRRVSRGNRRNMQSDFIFVQETVAELCSDLNNLGQQPAKKKPSKNMKGIN